MDWQIEEKMPRFDDINDYEILISGTVRVVRRIGNHSRSFSPGTLVFTDCTHPAQNMICDESRVTAWRIKDTAVTQ